MLSLVNDCAMSKAKCSDADSPLQTSHTLAAIRNKIESLYTFNALSVRFLNNYDSAPTDLSTVEALVINHILDVHMHLRK